jgi:shikimate dehydrogenase
MRSLRFLKPSTRNLVSRSGTKVPSAGGAGIGGATRSYAVLGHPIRHTLSPRMHNAAFRALGMDAVYLAFDVAPERLMRVLPAMADMGFGGVNLTVPLKEVAFRGLRDLDEHARILGAVNTVEFRPDGLRGYNTDGPGFLRAMREAFGARVKGLTVMILGTGGAGRALALTCAGQGARRLILSDTDAARPRRVAREVRRRFGPLDVETTTPDSWNARVGEADLVVNATPIGMHREDPSLLPAAAFRRGQMALDLVYMFPETAFMRAAKQGGARAANGLGMLLHQGAEAFEIWTRVKPPVDRMRAALESAVYGLGKVQA